MAHLRSRFATPQLSTLSRLWPVVGILGARQVGKTTLLQLYLDGKVPVSLDDVELREEAIHSPKSFLARQSFPIAIDEIQKAPQLFDTIKLIVDRKRIPGRFFLTGSSAFSSKLGIRESLTGRIGLLYLNPMTLAETHQKPFRALSSVLSVHTQPRFDLTAVMPMLLKGGVPVPAFLRNPGERENYWSSWLDTTLSRDLSRMVGKGYDPDLAYNLLRKMGSVLSEGELPTLKHFAQPARRVRQYFNAMEQLFLLRRIACHELGIGKDVWILFDAGIAAFLMGKTTGAGATLSLARHFLWNEWLSQNEYQGKRLPRIYYKSAQGSPIDLVVENTPIRIVGQASDVTRRLRVEERPLLGAMKKLGAKRGFIVAPVEQSVPAGKNGIGILPWSAWS